MTKLDVANSYASLAAGDAFLASGLQGQRLKGSSGNLAGRRSGVLRGDIGVEGYLPQLGSGQLRELPRRIAP